MSICGRRRDDTVVGRAPRDVRGVGAGDQRLGGHAAGVHAGAAEQLALDERDRHAGGRQAARQRRTRLAGADDDGVEAPHRRHRHDQERAADRDRVLDEGGGTIAAERRREPRAHGASAERADHRADHPGDQARSQEPPAQPRWRRPTDRPMTMRVPNWIGHRAARRRRQLVGDELAEREHA